MIKPKDHFHGSDLEKIESLYGIQKEDIISFSANVNPLGLSAKLRETLSNNLEVITSYPDREYTSLRKAIGTYCNTDFHHIVVGNGSTELISLLIQLKAPKHAMIIAPTYSEYEREVGLEHGATVYYPLKEENDFLLQEDDLIAQLTDQIDLLIICNPNNPTSTSITNTQMESVLKACKSHGIFVMVDETYIEFTDNYDDITCIPLTEKYDNIIILRGVSKFFAAPGLRLGYAITGNEELISFITKYKNPWTINSLADIAGQFMFSDAEYIQATKTLITTERTRIYHKLLTYNCLKVYQPTANFILVRILSDAVTADDIFEAAIKKNYMVRDCSSFQYLDDKYFRFCFMNPDANTGLLNCLDELFQKADV